MFDAPGIHNNNESRNLFQEARLPGAGCHPRPQYHRESGPRAVQECHLAPERNPRAPTFRELEEFGEIIFFLLQ